MADFGATSLTHLAGVKPVTEYRAVQMAAYVTAHGGDISIPPYGGLRTMAQQAQLLQWEKDSVARGEPAYAVHAPNAHAAHTTGDAFDVRVNMPLDGMTVDETYQAMAVYAPNLGLTAGYFFKSVPADPYHFENTDRSLVDVPTDGAIDSSAPGGVSSGVVVTVIAVLGLLGLLIWKRSH